MSVRQVLQLKKVVEEVWLFYLRVSFFETIKVRYLRHAIVTTSLVSPTMHRPLLLFICTLLASAGAWGPLGHSTVASVALTFLKPETLHRTREILRQDNTLVDATLVSIANWADSYRKTPDGRFSYFYHFIDAEDDPASGLCQIDMTNDCPPAHGCIITAM